MRKLEEIEAEIIRKAIERYDGRMSEVARRLGIGRSTLYRKLKEYGLEAGEELVESADEQAAEAKLAAGS
jgi:DNA-binding NtrC family response regulator